MFARLPEAFFVGLLVAATQLTAVPVWAAPDGVTKGEFKCENGVATKMSVMITRKGVCVQRCLDQQRETSGPYTDCFTPFGGQTVTCLFDPEFGVEARTRLAIGNKCSIDCPECYALHDVGCADGEPGVTNVANVLDVLSGLIYCTEAGGNTPSKAQGKCENVVAKVTAKMIDARIECYKTCFAKYFNGQVSWPDCVQQQDPALAACIQRIADKAVFKIDAACGVTNGTPACYNNADGSAWVGLTGGYIDGQVPFIACTDDTCHDGMFSGDETDVDCGGSCTQKCSSGQGCTVDADCASGLTCPFGFCQ